MSRRTRWGQEFMSPGESTVNQLTLTGSRDIRTDTPEDGLTAVLTSHRVLFLAGRRLEQLYWSVDLRHIASVETPVRWQNGVINKGRETVLVFRFGDGSSFTVATIHVVEGRRAIKRFVADLQASVH